MATFDERLSASRVRLRARLPFYGSLLLFARVVATESVEYAATDGRDLFLNPTTAAKLSASALDGLLLHEVLHAALLHVDRRKTRDPLRWNVAADIVVNGIIATLPKVTLPAGALRDADLEHLAVEEVYERLEGRVVLLPMADLLAAPDEATPDQSQSEARAAQWREALAQAEALSQMTVGTLPSNLRRALGEVLAPTLDWRSMLWRFITVTPSDFSGFDRRFVHAGLYLEELVGESVEVAVCVDTSGSISGRQLDAFLGELRGIVSSYPHLKAALYYADAALAGPYEVSASTEIPAPVGGGGTDFRPFFDAITKTPAPNTRVLVYLTDGYGTFPAKAPDDATLWVVNAGGLASEQFPFGEVARLREGR